MGFLVELGLDLVARPTGTPHSFFASVFGERVAALDHKTFDDAMKGRAIVKSLFGERLEILDGLGRDVRPEFGDHFAFGGVDDGSFTHK